MGCWNETCALTNLPIFIDEDVVMLVTIPYMTTDYSHLHYWDDAAPMVLPIYGKYDDYGSIKDCTMSDMTRTVLETTPMFIKDNGAYEPFDFQMNQFAHLIERKRLYIKNTSVYKNKEDEYLQLGLVMYHKGAFELVCDDIANRIPCGHDEAFYNVLKKSFAHKLKANRVKFIKKEAALRKLQDTFRNPEMTDEETRKSLLSDIVVIKPTWSENTFMRFILANNYDSIIYNTDDSDCDNLIANYVDELAKAVCFFYGLSLLRKSFYGFSGKGSQDSEMYLHERLAKWTISHVEKARKKSYEESTDTADDLFKDTLRWWEN